MKLFKTVSNRILRLFLADVSAGACIPEMGCCCGTTTIRRMNCYGTCVSATSCSQTACYRG
ncbi:MAG TPA: hypothetical protein VE153_39905 [Myxococcus sp.]|nr:hypothetical protein [Myxococcus sp.]